MVRALRRLMWLGQTPWPGYLAALGAVAAAGGFIGLVQGHQRIAYSSMLYLIAVLAIALAYGRGPAPLVDPAEAVASARGESG